VHGWSLNIELENTDHAVPAGEPVRGKLHVMVGDKADHKGIGLRWRVTVGAAGGTLDFDPEVSVLHESVLHPGPSTPGDALELPFEFEAPPGPLSYRGSEVKVGHVLEAFVDLTLARDPSVEIELNLVPGSESTRETGSGSRSVETIELRLSTEPSLTCGPDWPEGRRSRCSRSLSRSAFRC